MKMDKITFANLQLSPYHVTHLLEVDLVQKGNEHATFFVKALLPDNGLAEFYVERTGESSVVKLSSQRVDGSEFVLFYGMVKEIEVYAIAQMNYLEIHGISFSYQYDLTKRTCTYQDKSMTYTAIFDQVTARHPAGGVADFCSDGAATKQLLVQYQETDWEFLKRLASHFHAVLMNDITVEAPWIYAGLPIRKTIEIEAVEYRIKMDTGECMAQKGDGRSDVIEAYFLSYEVETEQEIKIGDQVNFNGSSFFVSQIRSQVEAGIFQQWVTITTDQGVGKSKQFNSQIIGSSLGGSIQTIKNDQVTVTLDCDIQMGHSPGAPLLFPYSTIYSSQDGSGWYCMPEIGDSVRIYFPDAVEDHGYAISSIHNTVDLSLQPAKEGASDASSSPASAGAASYSGQRDDPNVKSIRNKDGKEIRLTPEGIYILSDGTLITLLDEEGVSIISDKDITFQSEKNIVICAEDSVTIAGDTGVDLNCTETASIKMKEKVEIIGQEVMSN